MCLVVVGVGLGLVSGEIITRDLLPSPNGPFAHNPIIRKQAEEADLFEHDAALGHRLREGRFIGTYAHGLIAARDIARDPRRKGKLLLLNLGDSSTSGWDSNVVAENAQRREEGKPLLSPFQTYRTYSDILAESPLLYIVNAGVPGFTSSQGKKYLARLLVNFHRLGIRIDFVTIYFGNNDSAWNGNLRDKYVLPGEGFQLELLRLVDQASGPFRVVPRVGENRYAKNIAEMVRMCRRAGVDPVLVEPVIPKYWMPGLRAHQLQEESDRLMALLKGTRVLGQLEDAQRIFLEGRRAAVGGDLRTAASKFVLAQERDFVVPRIKQPHVLTLRAVARVEQVPIVEVGDQIPLDDRQYFLDYCHPIEPANELLAEGILRAIAPAAIER